MRAKKLVACALSAAMMLGLASMTGCGSAKKDYDLYIYNTKSEIADSIRICARIMRQRQELRLRFTHVVHRRPWRHSDLR